MRIISHTVRPKLAGPLAPLDELAHNIWISWNFDASQLFMRIDYDLWIESAQNPARMLGMVPQERYDELLQDDSFLAALDEVVQKFESYKRGETWYKGPRDNLIAYFSMEYGLDVSLPIYSGGLGILSGDHMKTASDMGLPLVGVGLLYRQGYFRQHLNRDGYQQEAYPENDWYNMPVYRCLGADGNPILISVDMAGRTVAAAIWEVKVGRNSLYLLDTNIDENEPMDRVITAALYGGDKDMRIRQELLLGIGGIRALRALGIDPAVTHMNEGHAAFLALERIRILMSERGFSFRQALQVVYPTNIFTTHTPVPAGNERFGIDLMERYFRSWSFILGLDWKDFLALGRQNPEDYNETFCMTILALRVSAYNNGVSELHGDVSRALWRDIWPGLPDREVPITAVTNGVHPRTWISHNMLEVLDRYFGPRFYEEPAKRDIWDRMDRISDEELWRTHGRRRSRLVVFAREQLKLSLKRNGATDKELHEAEDTLSPYALTIAFARRFATYKRGNLLLRDPERLMRLMADPERPIQIIFAGKAHPHDTEGKELIRQLVHFSRRPEVQSRIVFLENYDMAMARYMVSGADIWLNTPRRPMEASGTSGMKAGMNGVLNCSILDGWWAEAYTPEIGFAIGSGEEYKDAEIQDRVESEALYDLLEREIIPLFFKRGRDGLPREWIAKMKASMRTIGKNFSTFRMLEDYSHDFYLPALQNHRRFAAEDFKPAGRLAAYVERLKASWPGVHVADFVSDARHVMERGEHVTVRALVNLAGLSPDDVRVECCHGNLSSQGQLDSPMLDEMPLVGYRNNLPEFAIEVSCVRTGQLGYAVRILPKHPDLVQHYLPGFVRWA